MSVQEILYPRCILGHKIGGFRTSEGLPNHRPPKLTIREIDRINDLCKHMNDLCKRMSDLCKRIEWDVTT